MVIERVSRKKKQVILMYIMELILNYILNVSLKCILKHINI